MRKPRQRVAGGRSHGNFAGTLDVPTLDGLGVIGDGPQTREVRLLLSRLVPRTRPWVRLDETLEAGRPGRLSGYSTMSL